MSIRFCKRCGEAILIRAFGILARRRAPKQTDLQSIDSCSCGDYHSGSSEIFSDFFPFRQILSFTSLPNAGMVAEPLCTT
jgi:hypothetical protein